MSTVVHWFRSDLRLHDNPALLQSLRGASKLVCAYVLDPKHDLPTRWGFARMGAHRRRFLADTLDDLADRLAALGQRLHLLRGRPHDTLPELARLAGALRIGCEDIAAPEEQADVAALRAAGVEVDTCWQSSLLDPADLPFQVRELPRVFTQFRKAVESAGAMPRAPLSAPASLPPQPESLATSPSGPRAGAGPLASSNPEEADDPRSSFPFRSKEFSGGESTALRHLAAYFDGDLPQRYKSSRNGLFGVDYSTKFSPWLASGALSPRTVFAALREHEARRGANEDTYWIWFELLWRDYFRFLQLQHGRRLYSAEGLSGRPTSRHDDATFRHWCEGRTGQEFIDSGMRELAATGYLSNRLRQNVASWLVNDIGGDYRAGAAWFESQLIDYDPYSNQGNWLYLSGRGTDPRAGRRFDPLHQAELYDADGAYRGLWNT